MTHAPAAPAIAPLRQGARLVIVGGGATGVIAAAHLLAQRADFQIVLVEGRFEPGRGVAYSTNHPQHLLNTRIHQMSAFADQPDHLLQWLQAQPGLSALQPHDFIARSLYGRYLVALVEQMVAGGRLTLKRDIALAIEPARGRALLASGDVVSGDLILLATGHALPETASGGGLTAAFDFRTPADRDAGVVIIGTGLSMVDQVLALLAGGHRGPITALSRRGLLPLPHGPSKPLALTPADLPLGRGLAPLLRHLRQRARRAEADGGSWRDVMDGLRPHISTLWQALSLSERARFLRHGASFWEIHRHRIPAASDQTLRAAMAEGRLHLIRAGYQGLDPAPDGTHQVRIKERGAQSPRALPAAVVLDCRGIRRDPLADASPVFKDLYARGLARLDALKIGPDVTANGQILTQSGAHLPGVLALGPPSRAALWEITAIPDIRLQAAQIARALAG